MGCIENIVKGLYPVVDPNSTTEELKQEKVRKANGYLAFGIIVATAAVALAALGIAIAAILNPGGLALVVLAIPVFWLGHTICKFSINYKEIVKNNAAYWDEPTQFANDYQLHLDLTKGTLYHRCLSQPQVKEAFEKTAQARLNLREVQQSAVSAG